MTADITKIKVINVMKDGTILESMKGVVPPAETGVYEVIARIARKRAAERDRDRAESIESVNTEKGKIMYLKKKIKEEDQNERIG